MQLRRKQQPLKPRSGSRRLPPGALPTRRIASQNYAQNRRCEESQKEVIPVDKLILYQYIDAYELIKDTEREIERIRSKKREIVTDKVKGSAYDFPFGQISYTIRGIPDNAQDEKALDRQERTLEERKAAAEVIKLRVEEWLSTVPLRMQRIIQYKVFDGMTWAEVAVRMGRKATADSVKKEYQRFMAEK